VISGSFPGGRHISFPIHPKRVISLALALGNMTSEPFIELSYSYAHNEQFFAIILFPV